MNKILSLAFLFEFFSLSSLCLAEETVQFKNPVFYEYLSSLKHEIYDLELTPTSMSGPNFKEPDPCILLENTDTQIALKCHALMCDGTRIWQITRFTNVEPIEEFPNDCLIHKEYIDEYNGKLRWGGGGYLTLPRDKYTPPHCGMTQEDPYDIVQKMIDEKIDIPKDFIYGEIAGRPIFLL